MWSICAQALYCQQRLVHSMCVCLTKPFFFIYFYLFFFKDFNPNSLNKNMTEMIQQSAMILAKQTKKQKKPKMSSPTRALMKKRREMIENNTPIDHIEYVEICKTIKKKAREDIRKHILDEIRETIEASKSLKKVRRTHNLGKNRMVTLLDKHGKEIQEQDKIMERIEEFYSELCDSDQAVTIQTDPEDVPLIMA